MAPTLSAQRLLIVGGGWAGLAAAVTAVQAGAHVTLSEMAPQLGGRARSWSDASGRVRDSGQHILIGAYRDTLALMQQVGADPGQLLRRLPLTLVDPDGVGLRWGGGPALWAAARAVWAHPRWGGATQLALARWGLGLVLRGAHVPETLSVAELTRTLPVPVREQLIDPLCIAALNTRPEAASARVLLRVLRDALFGGAGGSDLLLPAAPLGALLPGPAQAWLQARGAHIALGQRVQQLRPQGQGWADAHWQGQAVILAASANESARLARPHAPAWADLAEALPAEAIATLTLRAPGLRLPAPMVALQGEPAQFLFDHGQLDPARNGEFSAVASAVAAELEGGLEPMAQRIEAQLAAQVPALRGAQRLDAHADRRATFACLCALRRPPVAIAPGLWAAGDYVAGPYPATLEGAVRAGRLAAACALGLDPQSSP